MGCRRIVAVFVVTTVAMFALPVMAKQSDNVPIKVEIKTSQPVVKLDPVVLKLKKDSARVAYLEGKRHCATGDAVLGMRALRKAHASERLPDLLFEMAACYARSGKMKQAYQAHRRYVRQFRKPSERLVAAARFGTIVDALKAVATAR